MMRLPFLLRLSLILMLLPASRVGAEGAATPLSMFMRQPAPHDIVYAERDGQELVLHTFFPEGHSPADSRPAILWIHGGAWVGGTTDGFMPLARYFASRGMVTFNITYRLARPDAVGVNDCIRDCRSALRHVRAQARSLGIDPNRIAVAGDSAGGHLAAALGVLTALNHPDDDPGVRGTADAMILYNPIVDMTEGEWIRFAVGGRALKDRKSPLPSGEADITFARSLSPLFNVAAGQPPTLLLHGLGDRIVDVEQARRFTRAYREAGNRCDLILKGEEIGHAFVIAAYKWPEPVVVRAVREADEFIVSLGWIQGPPTLAVSEPPAW